MTRNFSRWEVDPFFSAAEEVQDSADRLESAHRTWIHTKDLIATAPDDNDDDEAASSIEFRRRELNTALGTAKWQLEEFERAVSGLFSTDHLYVGEDAPARHKQFVEAIRNQITSIEKALLDSEDIRDLKALPMVNLDDEDKDDFAMFLSGSRARESHAERDLLTNAPGEEKAYEESASTSSGSRESRGWVSRSRIVPVSSSDKSLEKTEVRNSDNHLPYKAQSHDVRSLGNHCMDRVSTLGKMTTGFLDIRVEQSDRALSDPAAEGVDMECRIHVDGDCCRGIHVERGNGQRRSASVGSGLNSWKTGSVVKGTTINKIFERGQVESGTSGLSLWSFFNKRQPALELKVSKSGFKRWKDGDANSKDRQGISSYCNPIGGTGNLEKGTGNIWLGGNINCLNGYASGITLNGEDTESKGWSESFQRRLQRSQHALPSSRPVQIASAILVALGLVGLLSFHATTSVL